MTKPDPTLWTHATHDAMSTSIAAILRAAGFTNHYATFSMYETTIDGVKPDLSDWMVKHPTFSSTFARGKAQFILAVNDDDEPMLVEGHTDPTWADVLVMAEKSCRARGAPELDHIFLEAVEPVGPRRKGCQTYSLEWGS